MDLKKKQNIMYPGTVNFDFCINCNVEKLSKRDKNTQESAVTEVFESFLKSQSAPCKNCLNSCFERTKLKHLLSKSSYKSSAVRFVCSRVVQLYYKLALRFESIFAEFPMGPTLPPLSRMYCGVPVKPNPVKDLSLTLSQQRTVILLLWAAWWNFPITLQDAIILCP